MQSLHVISSLSASAGGPSYTVPRLAEALQDLGNPSQIATLSSPYNKTPGGVPVNIYKSDTSHLGFLNKLGLSRSMNEGLSKLQFDIVHVHGLWRMTNIHPIHIANSLHKPIVLSPRGMLSTEAMNYSKFSKQLFWNIWQRKALSIVGCLHATAESELLEIRQMGLKVPVAIIPNGVDLSERTCKDQRGDSQQLLSLGRFHPKKGIDSLINAFSIVSHEFPSWKLRIVGFDENNYSEYLMRCIKQNNMTERITIESPVYGDKKFDLMEESSIFVLPSLNENFAVTVAESLSVGTPVICSKGAPWPGLELNNCGWWYDQGTINLSNALRTAMSTPFHIRATMGQNGKEWMLSEFKWEGISRKMLQVYGWLLGHESVPPFVFI